MSFAMQDRELESSPASAPLYAKALFGSVVPGASGGALPAHALVLRGVEVDNSHLADYDRVCGFQLADELPSTYLHILAFPLAMSLMCERSFPFPLLGLVHVANSIEQHRPVGSQERPTLRVWAENMRPHRRGRQLDVVAQAEIDGEIVWTDRSTYLSRGGGGEEPAAAATEVEDFSWAEGAIPRVWRIPGDIGRRYADVSGDRNPIHLHALTARLFGFPTAIAHGMWTAAHALAAFQGTLPPAFRFDVNFRAPVRLPAGARLFARTEENGTQQFVLAASKGDITHLTGSITPS